MVGGVPKTPQRAMAESLGPDMWGGVGSGSSFFPSGFNDSDSFVKSRFKNVWPRRQQPNHFDSGAVFPLPSISWDRPPPGKSHKATAKFKNFTMKIII